MTEPEIPDPSATFAERHADVPVVTNVRRVTLAEWVAIGEPAETYPNGVSERS